MITENELLELNGLPHIQQIIYLRGIRPYMDINTGLVGIKRHISHQSIAETLYIDPKPGIKEERFSRDQVRRALGGLERAGLIINQSKERQLLLKCPLAKWDYSVQNKAAILPPYQAATLPPQENPSVARVLEDEVLKATTGEPQKAAMPLYNNNYIYLLLQRFEKFWSLYPEKKSKEAALHVFQQLNPAPELFNTILCALSAQIKHREMQQLAGIWVPPWKYPATWLTKKSWEDELSLTETNMENGHATHKQPRKLQQTSDPFEYFEEPSNVIELAAFKKCE